MNFRSRYTDEEIKGQAQLKIILTIFRYIFHARVILLKKMLLK